MNLKHETLIHKFYKGEMMENIKKSDEEIISVFEQAIPYFKYFFDEEISVALTDTSKFLVNMNCESIRTNAKYGDPIPSGGAAQEVISLGKPIIKEVSEHVYGVPFKSYAVPLKNGYGKTVGAVLIAKNMEKSKKVKVISQNLSSTMNQISLSINNLTEELQELAAMNEDISVNALTVEEQTRGTDEVLHFIQKISNQSNLLGLNAAIEATRAGEAGRAFNVVAKEIGKMATSTSKSVEKINSILSNIEQSVKIIVGKISNSNESFHRQTEELEEIAAALEELNQTAKEMAKISNEI